MTAMAYKKVDLTEITRLLLNMRDNCVQKENETYDDPLRRKKLDALNYAIDVINNPSMSAMAMVDENHFAIVEAGCVEVYSKNEFFATPTPVNPIGD